MVEEDTQRPAVASHVRCVSLHTYTTPTTIPPHTHTEKERARDNIININLRHMATIFRVYFEKHSQIINSTKMHVLYKTLKFKSQHLNRHLMIA